VTYVPLAHSIPEGNGLLIETPFGNVFHTGDWKIDETPVLGHLSSAETLTDLGDAGVLALVCDSTNVFQDNASGSEAGVHAGLLEAVLKARGRVLITTFASNATVGDDRPGSVGDGTASVSRGVASNGFSGSRRRPAISRTSRSQSASTKR
jgi:hypothetical protein